MLLVRCLSSVIHKSTALGWSKIFAINYTGRHIGSKFKQRIRGNQRHFNWLEAVGIAACEYIPQLSLTINNLYRANCCHLHLSSNVSRSLHRSSRSSRPNKRYNPFFIKRFQRLPRLIPAQGRSILATISIGTSLPSSPTNEAASQ